LWKWCANHIAAVWAVRSRRDPRNDPHVIVSQMHLAFVHAHNAFVDRACASGQTTSRVRDVREPFAAITAA
jgi:hypothetical protein